MKKITLTIEQIAAEAGHAIQAGGKLNLPAMDCTAEQLAEAALALAGAPWKPGDERVSVVLTGAGPAWAYMAIAHALHGHAVKLTYMAPNAEIVIWRHGA